MNIYIYIYTYTYIYIYIHIYLFIYLFILIIIYLFTSISSSSHFIKRFSVCAKSVMHPGCFQVDSPVELLWKQTRHCSSWSWKEIRKTQIQMMSKYNINIYIYMDNGYISPGDTDYLYLDRYHHRYHQVDHVWYKQIYIYIYIQIDRQIMYDNVVKPITTAIVITYPTWFSDDSYLSLGKV